MNHATTAIVAIALGALAGLTGCAVGPDYHRPNPLPGTNALPASFGDLSITNHAGQWKKATPEAQLPRGQWWSIYNDAELNRLETLAASNNQQIVVAVANLAESRAQLGIAEANFYPQISADPSLTRQRTSANTYFGNNVNSSGYPAGGTSRTYNTFSVQGDATWEIDFFGRVRRLTESARDTLTASAEDLESMKLLVQAEVASDYFTLRSQDGQSDLLTQASGAYKYALNLTQNRRKSGIADAVDVEEAESQLKSTLAQISAIDLQRAQTRHALAVLCGEPATTFRLTQNSVASTNVPAVPLLVPSEWLERRPDVAAAERSMAAANANVGVATAAFYPKVMLNGSGGVESLSASDLFEWPSHVWALGPTVELPLFTGGQNRAQLANAKAAYNAAVGNYRQTVLSAFQDVEDQLAGVNFLTTQLEQESEAQAAAQRTVDLTMQQYRAGIQEYLNVITVQTIELTDAQTVMQLRGQRLAASVNLIKALGGGLEPVKP